MRIVPWVASSPVVVASRWTSPNGQFFTDHERGSGERLSVRSMVKHFSYLLRAVVAVVATGAFALVPLALSGSAQAASAPQVKLKTSAHTVSTSRPFTLTAKTAHKVPGTKVVLQQKVGGSWQRLGRFPYHAGGRLKLHAAKGDYRLRAMLKEHGRTLDVSPVVVIHVTAPKPHASAGSAEHTAPASHSCTRTSTGSCIQGGEFCQQSMYGQTGYDGGGRSWVCTGDTTHPHWE